MKKIKIGKMKLVLALFLYLSFLFNAFADINLKEFTKLRGNEFNQTKIFETNEFYYSQVSYDWTKNPNRKKLSRKGVFQSLENFKNFYISTKINPNIKNLQQWQPSYFIKNKLSVKEARKIEDRRFEDRYLVVYSIPKNKIEIKIDNLNLSDLLRYNTLNHFQFSKEDRDNYLTNVDFKEILLLWKIREWGNKYNLSNTLSLVEPINHQNKILEIIKTKKIDLRLLDDAPGFDYIVKMYLEKNKISDKYEYLSILSSACSSSDTFNEALIKNNIYTIKTSFFKNYKSPIFYALKRCNGFINFDQKLNSPSSLEMKKIEEKFNDADDLEGLINLIEKTISKSPLNFKLWNYYSACLRAQDNFLEALLVSRVEISLALQLNNEKIYLEALKSFAKAKIKIKEKNNEPQERFLRALI